MKNNIYTVIRTKIITEEVVVSAHSENDAVFYKAAF